MPRPIRAPSKARKAASSANTAVVEYGRHRGAQRVRVDAARWVDTGIQILVRESIEHVSVERVARALGVTKGSFYWHFKNRADLHAALLDRWIKKATIDVRERVEREKATASEKMLSLLELPFWSPRADGAADLELAIRAWARRSPLARQAVQRVDRLRLDYLSGLFDALEFDAAEAVTRAHLTYALIRYLSEIRDMEPAEMHRTIELAHAQLLCKTGTRKKPSLARVLQNV